MNFGDYIDLNFKKAVTSEEIVIEKPVLDDTTIYDEMKKIDSSKWIAKDINGEKILFHNSKYLNMTSLKDALREVYKKNGYENYGFGRLSEEELIKYKTVRGIIAKEFTDVMQDEVIDSLHIAELIFKNEYKNFEWSGRL